MRERPENLNAAGDESGATLIAPRFDAEEARRAHPVVPLAEARPRAPFAAARAHARPGLRRSWPRALLAVALLAVAVVSGVVTARVLRGSQPSAAASQAPEAVAPAQAAEVPPPEAQTPPDAAAAPRIEGRAESQPARPRVVRDRG
ncbi:MAG TPA: hypothetical protein VF611_13145, partial [Pyrinomonadaceae bacterium]